MSLYTKPREMIRLYIWQAIFAEKFKTVLAHHSLRARVTLFSTAITAPAVHSAYVMEHIVRIAYLAQREETLSESPYADCAVCEIFKRHGTATRHKGPRGVRCLFD
jgi:hypothetical protein